MVGDPRGLEALIIDADIPRITLRVDTVGGITCRADNGDDGRRRDGQRALVVLKQDGGLSTNRAGQRDV